VIAILYRLGSCFDRGNEARGGRSFWLGVRGDEARAKCAGIGADVDTGGVDTGGEENDGAGPMVNCGGACGTRTLRLCRCSL